MIILIGFIIIGIVGAIWGLSASKYNGAKARNAQRKAKLQKTFSALSIGMPFYEVDNRFGTCEAISQPNLVSEVLLETGVHRKVYIWYLDWEVQVSRSFGTGSTGFSGISTYPMGAGVTFSGGSAVSSIKGQTVQKAYIQTTFEDGKLTSKEQYGLFQDMIIK